MGGEAVDAAVVCAIAEALIANADKLVVDGLTWKQCAREAKGSRVLEFGGFLVET